MLGLFSHFCECTPPTRRPASSRPRPRRRPFVERLEGRAVPATVTVSIFGTPNPAVPGALVSFPVTITGNLGPNDTDIQGSATVVDVTTGVQLANIPMVYAGGTPNSTVLYKFTASGTFAAGAQTIMATFHSSDPATADSSGSTVEVLWEPATIITVLPNQTSVISVSRHKHKVKETLEVPGTSKTPVQGPFFLAVEINPEITLVNATGKTVSRITLNRFGGEIPLRTPYVKLTPSSISKTHPAKVTLIFDDPLLGKIRFTNVLLQTTGTP